jgi:hypothetical protein
MMQRCLRAKCRDIRAASENRFWTATHCDLVHIGDGQEAIRSLHRIRFALSVQRLKMVAIAKALARALPKDSLELEVLKQLALFCGAGLLVSLLLLSYGLDLSPAFF